MVRLSEKPAADRLPPENNWQFIVDFYISSCKLVIELDGAQHTEPQAVEYDAQRTAYLQGIGCRVLRYANNAVDTNFAGVCEDILHNIG